MLLLPILMLSGLNTVADTVEQVEGQMPERPPQGGRVIEFDDESGTSSDVIPSRIHGKEANKNKVENKQEQKADQVNSVKLITGGDPSDGNAKSGRLPILD
ncbi:MAG: hypothetical protein AAF387_20985 [Pseudomonadota bacterium]